MKTILGTFQIIIGLALLAILVAPAANAQCVNLGIHKTSALMLPQALSAGQFIPAAFTPAAYPAQEEGGSLGIQQEPLVGFWYVKFTSDTPGLFFDWGYSQYHSDGTEILNSGTGARKFCTGVWTKTGPSTYEVNHFAIAYTYGATPAFIGIVNIRETITVGSGHDSFSGTFTVGIYDQSGNLLGPPHGPGFVTGTIEGRRITVDTPVTDVLPAVAP